MSRPHRSRETPVQSVFLVTGGTGRLGYALTQVLAPPGRVAAPPRSELNLASIVSIRRAVAEIRPTVIINAAAYTDVDAADAQRDECFLINAIAPGILSSAVHSIAAATVHFSTDYVFDGRTANVNIETNEPRPLNTYGASKLQGELELAAGPAPWIAMRTSWMYGAYGRNFLGTMLTLARERDEIRVVNDQIGTPTWSHGIAVAMARVVAAPDAGESAVDRILRPSGVYHITAQSAASWFEFARAILMRDPERHEHRCRRITPIRTDEYPTPAERPRRSVLNTDKFHSRFGWRLGSWEAQLDSVLS
jgi:dTDP-4-dehydrorhamnose reductase